MIQKRFPSLHTLQETFQITLHEAFHIRELMRNNIDATDFERARNLVLSGDSPKYWWTRFVAIDQCLAFHGIENLTVGLDRRASELPAYLRPYHRQAVYYSNSGDSYYPTVCYVEGLWKIRSVAYWMGDGR